MPFESGLRVSSVESRCAIGMSLKSPVIIYWWLWVLGRSLCDCGIFMCFFRYAVISFVFCDRVGPGVSLASPYMPMR